MLFAQVGMGFNIDMRFLVAIWAGLGGFILALGILACRLVAPHRRGLILGLGIGTCLMSSLAIILWVWSGSPLPPEDWIILYPAASLLAGSWAVVYGAKAWRWNA